MPHAQHEAKGKKKKKNTKKYLCGFLKYKITKYKDYYIIKFKINFFEIDIAISNRKKANWSFRPIAF